MHAPPPAPRAVVRGRQLTRRRIPEGYQQGLEVRGGDPGRRAPGFRARPHVPLATLLGDPPLHRGRPEMPLCRDGHIAAFTHLVGCVATVADGGW